MIIEYRDIVRVMIAAAFLCAAMPASAQSFDGPGRRYAPVPVKTTKNRPQQDRARNQEREPEIEFGTVLNDTVITPDGRRFRITKAKALFSELEMVEPVGAKVDIFNGTRAVYTNDIPFIWNKATSSDYVKIQVTERERVWAFKILPEQGTRLVIGKSAPSRPQTPVVKVQPAPKRAPQPAPKFAPSAPSVPRKPSKPTEPAGYEGRFLSMKRLIFRHGDAIDVLWHDTPGNALDWITVVPAGSPPGEWGRWSYTGEKTGRHRVSGLKPGRYEARISFDSSNDIEDRVEFTVTE